MRYPERLELFAKVQAEYSAFLSAVLWKLTGDKELFAEAMQYALLNMWRKVEKLNDKKAAGYIYKIALSANSRAWRNRIGNNGQFHQNYTTPEAKKPDDNIHRAELVRDLRKAISKLPSKQARAVVMRYFEQLDYETIAGKLCCSQAGARSHVSKALATLKKKLTTFSTLEVEK